MKNRKRPSRDEPNPGAKTSKRTLPWVEPVGELIDWIGRGTLLGTIGFALIVTRGRGPMPEVLDGMIGILFVVGAFLVCFLGVARALSEAQGVRALSMWRGFLLTFVLVALVGTGVHGFLNALLANAA